jgi:hypothetical protein
MDSDSAIGASILTGLVGIPLCILGAIYGGCAGLLSSVIFIIGFYQFVMAMALGGPGVGMCALLVIAFEVFILFCISALLFGQDVTIQAASYWKEPIAWGVAPVDNLWVGIFRGDSSRKWLGVGQLCGLSGLLLFIWLLIHLLGRANNG